jgi:hypothetical protein
MKRNLLLLAFAAAVSLVSFAAQAAGIDVAGFINDHREVLATMALMGSVQLPNGSVVAIANGYGSAKTMTGVSNANPGLAALSAGHGISTGDFMEVTSGWSRLTNKIVKAGNPVGSPGTDIPLAGINTTSTTLYPAGAGAGSVREITGWTSLLQILESSSNGGEQQFLTYQFLEDDAQKRIPTFKNAAGLTLRIADDDSLAGYILASEANDDRQPRAIRITLPDGGLILYNAYVSLNKTPTLTINELMAVEVTLSFLAEPVRY